MPGDYFNFTLSNLRTEAVSFLAGLGGGSLLVKFFGAQLFLRTSFSFPPLVCSRLSLLPPVPGAVIKIQAHGFQILPNISRMDIGLGTFRVPGFTSLWRSAYILVLHKLNVQKYLKRFLIQYLSYFIWVGCSGYPICHTAGKRDFPYIWFSLINSYLFSLGLLAEYVAVKNILKLNIFLSLLGDYFLE